MLKVNPDDFHFALAAKLAKPLFGTNSVEASPAPRAQVPLLICEIQSEKVAVAPVGAQGTRQLSGWITAINGPHNR